MIQTQAVASSGPGRLSRREVFVTLSKSPISIGLFTLSLALVACENRLPIIRHRKL
jgi:hypothetical protein